MYGPPVQAEIITIGDEICRGEIVDTNAAWMAAFLWDLDITTTWITSCRDEEDDMRSALISASGRADIVLCSGGLGPTLDDKTCDVVASLCESESVIHPPSSDQMHERYRAMGRKPAPLSVRQVRTPKVATAYLNPVGAAPGFQVKLNSTPLFCLPGPPSELKSICNAFIKDEVIGVRESQGEKIVRVARRIYRVFGLPESEIATRLDDLEIPKNASLHYQVKFPEILVKTVARAAEQADADACIEKVSGDILERIGDKVHGEGMDTLPIVVGRELTKNNLKLALAESCTGGLLSSLITQESGASRFFLGSMVTYANAEKMRQLDVPLEILKGDGAVSEACVRAMAEGCRKATGADVALAVSGIAGPGGGSEDKPVGLVWLAVSGPSGEVTTKRLMWPGTRDRIRVIAAHTGLHMVLRACRTSSSPKGGSRT